MIHLDEKEQARAMRNAYHREYHREKGRRKKEEYWQRKLTELTLQLEQAGHSDMAIEIRDCKNADELGKLLDQASEILGGLIS